MALLPKYPYRVCLEYGYGSDTPGYVPFTFFFNFFFLSNWVRQGYGFGAAWYAANPNYTVKKDATASRDSFTMKKEGGATTAHR